MTVNFFSLDKQTKALRKEIDQALAEVINSSRFILGPNVKAFEEESAKYCCGKFGIGVASGTDAITLSLSAAGIGPGDEVITVPFTFVATIESVLHVGAAPVFVDIEPKSFCVDASQIEAKITPKTKALLPVHLYGRLADMDSILKIAKKHNLKVIEDAAQAIGATQGKHVALSCGDAGATSFFPTKNLGGVGDGGLIVTNDEKIAAKVKALRGHGSTKTYMYDVIGYNSRLDEIQAAVLRIKLKKLDQWHVARNKNADLYYELLKDVSEVVLPEKPKDGRHVYNQLTIRAQKRDDLRETLKNKGIGAMVYYPLSLHKHVAYEFLGQKDAVFPECDRAEKEVLSLPIYPELTPEEIKEVVSAIKEFYV
ncbi:MAG: DegT/DnrJ/EryC1/StrS family aminotransferase [Candidatus Margulisbacteria bacterium]|nr:DegT/DnrJ/EryC1/StrS family aminotransferase [Candidatus Margulisiibacteriota bacterium]MBU1021992.1 DegT/DnrJ/EryC1/StrS family aminotransferase [Candidatus Margulisiibacteriota bacterium]MBU1728970.1 DegT/DnrJ/EryC1/StrS family aminotransferase [Candidatus Margulisiibacteriota bacterium]MBU1954776.1 DegT/DnrJ/EryC1/StrS family aminotransferase [Candidatus Margulisiibacteriota bacterium]